MDCLWARTLLGKLSTRNPKCGTDDLLFKTLNYCGPSSVVAKAMVMLVELSSNFILTWTSLLLWWVLLNHSFTGGPHWWSWSRNWSSSSVSHLESEAGSEICSLHWHNHPSQPVVTPESLSQMLEPPTPPRPRPIVRARRSFILASCLLDT